MGKVNEQIGPEQDDDKSFAITEFAIWKVVFQHPKLTGENGAADTYFIAKDFFDAVHRIDAKFGSDAKILKLEEQREIHQ
jgi:hypothetical protein